MPLDYRISRIVESALVIALKSLESRVSILDCRRCFATARTWSITATAGLLWQLTGTVIGGCGLAAVERGTTTTVLRKRFSMSFVRTTQGLVFLISEPWPGSSATHHISPRFTARPPKFHHEMPSNHQSRAPILCLDWLPGTLRPRPPHGLPNWSR